MSQLRLHQHIAGYLFEGPYLDIKRIPKGPGLYAIISHDGKRARARKKNAGNTSNKAKIILHSSKRMA